LRVDFVERNDQFFPESLGKILAVGISAEVLERQHGKHEARCGGVGAIPPPREEGGDHQGSTRGDPHSRQGHAAEPSERFGWSGSGR
jgi:hypothetical protein